MLGYLSVQIDEPSGKNKNVKISPVLLPFFLVYGTVIIVQTTACSG
jgi:hypothetical protein